MDLHTETETAENRRQYVGYLFDDIFCYVIGLSLAWFVEKIN